jgi:hypothetical protein
VRVNFPHRPVFDGKAGSKRHKSATIGLEAGMALTLLEIIQIELTLEQITDYSACSLAPSTKKVYETN